MNVISLFLSKYSLKVLEPLLAIPHCLYLKSMAACMVGKCIYKLWKNAGMHCLSDGYNSFFRLDILFQSTFETNPIKLYGFSFVTLFWGKLCFMTRPAIKQHFLLFYFHSRTTLFPLIVASAGVDPPHHFFILFKLVMQASDRCCQTASLTRTQSDVHVYLCACTKMGKGLK